MQWKIKILISIVGLGCLMIPSGCAPVAFMGAATGVVTSASEERGFKTVWTDAEIKIKIQLVWMQHKPELTHHIDIVVHQGQILLTGIVDTPQMQIDAIRLVWTVPGVREIINETTIGQETDFGIQDYWITTRLKTKLLMDENIRSLNYNVQTVNGIVYLMGIAQDRKELDQVTEYARHMQGVKKVVSHVQFRSQMQNQETKKQFQRPLKKKGGVRKNYRSLRTQEENVDPSSPVLQSDTVKERGLDAPNTGSSFQ